MSENFLKPDDVTIELATMLDEFSAVDCYRLKKNAPIGTPTKKALSYKAILKTNFPGSSSTDTTYKLPASIDMDYIDILSGKNSCKSTKVETKIPIRMESFEKLCYCPELTEAQKQAMYERSRLEAARMEEEMASTLSEEVDIYEDECGCSPCFFDVCCSPKKYEDILYEDLKGSENEVAEDDLENKPLTSPVSSITEELSHSSEESNTSIEVESTSVTQSVEETESNAPQEQISKEDSSTEKRKKSVFKRLFSRKVKKNQDLY